MVSIGEEKVGEKHDVVNVCTIHMSTDQGRDMLTHHSGKVKHFIHNVISTKGATNIIVIVFRFNKVKLHCFPLYNNHIWLIFLSHFVLLLFAWLPLWIKVAAERFPALVVALVKSLACLETPLGHCHTEG